MTWKRLDATAIVSEDDYQIRRVPVADRDVYVVWSPPGGALERYPELFDRRARACLGGYDTPDEARAACAAARDGAASEAG